MKIASLIARLLLGLIFLVFGLNGFLHFIPMPPPTGLAGQFFTALFLSHYWVVIFGLQVIGGVLLLINKYVPLALVLLGPVIVNILCFHAFMAPAGLPLAIIVAILWTIVALRHKQNFVGIFFHSAPAEHLAICNSRFGEAQSTRVAKSSLYIELLVV